MVGASRSGRVADIPELLGASAGVPLRDSERLQLAAIAELAMERAGTPVEGTP